MKTKVLVTGSSGYIGSYLLNELKDYQVVCLDRSSSRSNKKKIIADIRDKKKLDKVNEKFDALIHLAAIVGSYNKKLNYDTNVIGTKNIIDLARRCQIKQFIHISSVCAKKRKQGPYGKSKLVSEKLVLNSGLNYTIFKPPMVIGDQSQGLNRILKNIRRFPFFIPLIGQGKYSRQPIYIRDLIKLVKKSILNKKTYMKVYEAGGGCRLSFAKLVQMVAKIEGINKFYIPVPIWITKIAGKIFERLSNPPLFTYEHIIGLTENTKMDIRLLQKDLNYKPEDLKKALREILREIKNKKKD